MVARFVRDEEVAGSNPVTPTNKQPGEALHMRAASLLAGTSVVWPVSPSGVVRPLAAGMGWVVVGVDAVEEVLELASGELPG